MAKDRKEHVVIPWRCDELGWDEQGRLKLALRVGRGINLREMIHDQAAKAAFDDEFRAAITESLSQAEAQFAKWHPRLREAEKTFAEVEREQQRIDLDKATALDSLSGEALTLKLSDLSQAKAEHQGRLESSQAGLATLRDMVKEARWDLLTAFDFALSRAVKEKKQAIISSRASLDESFTLECLSARLITDEAIALLENGRICRTQALALASEEVQKADADERRERELKERQERERRDAADQRHANAVRLAHGAMTSY
jgi:hypothetical protein